MCQLDGSPAEVEEGLSGSGDTKVRPGQEVELGHGARLVSLQVLQVETPYEIVVTPDMFGHQVHLQTSKRKVIILVSWKTS